MFDILIICSKVYKRHDYWNSTTQNALYKIQERFQERVGMLLPWTELAMVKLVFF